MSTRAATRPLTNEQDESDATAAALSSLPLLAIRPADGLRPDATALYEGSLFAPLPESKLDQDEKTQYELWLDQLLGARVSAQSYHVVSGGQILTGFIPDLPPPGAPEDVFMGTIDAPANSIAGRIWWQQWANHYMKDKDGATVSKKLGEGAHNVTYLAPFNASDFHDAANFLRLFGGICPPKQFALRTGGETIRRQEVAKEFATTAYASYEGIGPRVYAMLFWEAPTDKPGEIGKVAGYSDKYVLPTAPSRDVKGANSSGSCVVWPATKLQERTVTSQLYVSEAWSGDCTQIIQPSNALACKDLANRVDPELFAALFVPLVIKAANAGIFHGDLKRANMLFRKDPITNRVNELCFTECVDARHTAHSDSALTVTMPCSQLRSILCQNCAK